LPLTSTRNKLAGLTGTGSQLFTQAAGAVERGDMFGNALTTGDFDNDGFADLAAGAPFEDVGTLIDAGAVSILYGSTAGLTTTGSRIFTQDTPGVPGTAEDEDHFGAALTSGNPGPAPAAAASQARSR
jgi:FG-GAP repeat